MASGVPGSLPPETREKTLWKRPELDIMDLNKHRLIDSKKSLGVCVFGMCLCLPYVSESAQ